MKTMLDALDERLRGLLARPCGRAARILCAALTMLGFSPAPSQKAVHQIIKATPDIAVEQIIKQALKML